MRFALYVVFALVAGVAGVAGCAGQTSPRAPHTPAENDRPSGAAPAPTADPFALGGPITNETIPEPPSAPPNLTLWAKTVDGVNVPKPPAACGAFTAKQTTKAACTDGIAALDAALGIADPKKRDAALASLEGCTTIPAGVVRALRADLAPGECADAIVDPLLRAPAAGISPPVMHALVGLSLAGRFQRTVGKPPAFAGPSSKDRIKAYIEGPYRKWVGEQAKAIEDLSNVGKELASYGRAVCAMEAGMADLRFIERVREAPVPEEFQRDQELKDIYFGTLDAMLEPRKARGRDATLVALNDYAGLGVIRDARVHKARALLGQLYAGRRIDALDALALPPQAAPSAASATERLLVALPTFYTSLLFDAPTLAPMLEVLSQTGVPATLRVQLASRRASLSPHERSVYARARLEMGKLYWRRADFDQAALLSVSPQRTPEDTLTLAVALALRHAPDGATAMMRSPTPGELNLGHVEALDALAKTDGPMAGLAAFDAALLLATAPPSGAEAPVHFDKVAARFHESARKISDAALARQAEERAKEAEATAKAK